MSPKLYIFNGGPPSRTVLLAAKAVEVNLDVRVLTTGEVLHTPEFLKINPTHTVPLFTDNDKILCDSHAIVAYLVEKYAKDDTLYPKDIYQRALVNEKLHFDTGILFPVFRTIIGGFIRKEYRQIPQHQIEEVKNVYAILEKILDGKKWLVGNNVTLADISCVTTTTSLSVFLPIDTKIFPNINEWVKRIKNLPYFNEDETQIEYFKAFLNRISNTL